MTQQTTPSFAARLLRFWQAVKSLDFSHHRYALWKRWHRLDLSGTSCEALGLDAKRSHYHAESGGPELEVVLQALDLPRYYVAVDLGSGKGGAVFTLAKYFRYVVGIELAPELVRIADKNADRLNLSRSVDFFWQDATQFEVTRNARVFYLFNPFPVAVVAEALARVKAKYSRPSECAWVLYKNPVGHAEVLAAGFTLVRVFTFPHGHPCYVYRG